MNMSDLRCFLCEENFSEERVPRVLNCGHTFCTVCTGKLLLRDKKCPECRCRISRKNVLEIPVNYIILRISQTLSAAKSSPPESLEHSRARCLERLRRSDARAKEMEKNLDKEVALILNFLQDVEKESKIVLGAMKKLCTSMQILMSKQNQLITRRSELQMITREIHYSINFVENTSSLKEMKCATESIVDKYSLQKFKLLLTGNGPSATQLLFDSALDTMSDSYRKKILWDALKVEDNVFAIESLEKTKRWAQLAIKDSRIVLYALQDRPPQHIVLTLPYCVARQLVPKKCPTVFLEIGWNGSSKGFTYIRMFEDSLRALQTTLMCSGERGPSYTNTVFYDADYRKDGRPYCISGGDYENNDGTGGRAIVDGITESDFDKHETVRGLIASCPASQPNRLGSFRISLMDDPVVLNLSSYGIVTEGLQLLERAAEVLPVINASVMNCGLVIPV